MENTQEVMLTPVPVESQEPKVHKKKKVKTSTIVYYFVYLLICAVIFIPIYIMLITSVTGEAESHRARFTWWPKMGITFASWNKALTTSMGGPNLLQAFANSLWIYVPFVAIGVFISTFAAYAFAKLDFTLKKPLFALLISGMTLPNCMGTIASFLMFDKLGWVGTPLPLIVPRMFGSVGILFFLRQFFSGIPDDLMGAARVDGLGEFGVFFYIMMPIAIPPMLSQFILTFISAYNDYLGPLLYLHNPDYWTLTIAISFFTEAYVQQWPLQMAGAAIATFPLLLMYLLSQKFILAGVAVSSGLKG
jgi:multiple sugar transport system permease protein